MSARPPVTAGDLAGLVPDRAAGRAAGLHLSHFKYDSVQTLDAFAIYKEPGCPIRPNTALSRGEFKITSARPWASRSNTSPPGTSIRRCVYQSIRSNINIFYGRTDPYTWSMSGWATSSISATCVRTAPFRPNIFGVEYYGFTEPDPDGNSYQPAPRPPDHRPARRLGKTLNPLPDAGLRLFALAKGRGPYPGKNLTLAVNRV